MTKFVDYSIPGFGSVLVDTRISQYGPSLIDPFIGFSDKSNIGISRGLSSCGYDLTLSQHFKKFESNLDYSIIDPAGLNNVGEWHDCEAGRYCGDTIEDFGDHKVYVLDPNEFILGCTNETIYMPTDLYGLAHLKSVWARTGLNMTLGALQPGWHGKLVLEFTNPTWHKIPLYAGEGIVHVTFFKIEVPQNIYNGMAQYQSGPDPRLPDQKA